MYPHLKAGYTLRSPTTDDISAILALLSAFDMAEAGEADVYTPDDILADWSALDPLKDSWVVIAPDGLLCGYATVTDEDNGRLTSDGYVHPSHYGCGIGTTLIEVMEARAMELVTAAPEGIRYVLVNNILASSVSSRTLLERRGYALARVFFRMHITMDAPPSPAIWPQGMSVRSCDGSPEEIRRAYEIIEEGFRDHWAHTPRSFEDWRQYMVREDFDPTLWFLAREGEEIAGAALCKVREAGRGWIEQVAVRRPSRKQGLGMALLRHAFGAFYERGIPKVGLGVDGQSLTGAQRLYERAGMVVTMHIARYEKELRAGRDLLEEQ